MGESERELLSTVQSLYDAALGHAEWSDALGRLTDFLGGNGYNLFVLDHRSMTIPFSVSVGIPPELLAEYSAEYAQIDPGLAYFNRNPGRPFYYTYLHSSEAEIRRHPYYDFLQRKGGDPYYLAYTFDLGEDRSAIATLQFSRAQGHAEQEDFRRAELFRAHIRNCVRIQALFQDMDLHCETARDALNLLPVAVFLQDRTGQVSFENAAAQKMLSAADGLSLRAGQVEFSCPRAQAQYRRALGAWARGDARCGDPPPDAIRARRASGRADYVVQLLPLKGRHPWIAGSSSAYVTLVSDPDRGVRLTGLELQALFGLTPTEAQVAALLAHGQQPAAVQSRLGVSRNTLNTHRKRIFEKLAVSSQAELARFLIAV
ncbi:MAG: LuxR C-terminal-related transcriptional regulator [Alphaproteobacteria bacterium]|nr:LuxR C-terminal-related transcriptional regulator [Alphaproteobacteria bacterium]